jgi:hypothetical protein
MYRTPEHLDELAAIWAANISDPPPNTKIFGSWLTQHGFKVMLYAVNTTVRRYNRGGIDFDGCLRYCSSVARSTAEKEDAFKVPNTWQE